MASSVLLSGSISYVELSFDEHRKLAFTLATAGLAVGSFLMSFAVSYIVITMGYKGVLYFYAGISVPVVLLSIVFRPKPAYQHGQQDRDRSKLYRLPNEEQRERRSIERQGLLGMDEEGVPEEDSAWVLEEDRSPRVPSSPADKRTYYSMFCDWRLWVYVLAVILIQVSNCITIVLSPDFVQVVFSATKVQSTYVIVAFSSGNLLGCLVSIATSSAQYSRLVCIASLLGVYALVNSVFPLTNYVAVCVFMAFFGAILGYVMSNMPQVIIDVFGQESFARYIGVWYTAGGIGISIGGPIGGAIKDSYSYNQTYLFSGACTFVGAGLLLVMFLCRRTTDVPRARIPHGSGSAYPE